MDWKIIKPATEVWHNDWLKIVAIEVRLPTGVEGDFYALDAPDGIAVLAVDDQHRVVLNRQFRPALGKAISELPSGQLGQNETKEEAVRRELAEESGIHADDLVYLGSFYRNSGRDTGSTHVYFARVTGETPSQQEKYEYLETFRIPLEHLIEQVMNNEIQDIATIFAVLMFQNRLMQGSIRL